MAQDAEFAFHCMRDLLDACVIFHRKNLNRTSSDHIQQNRSKLSNFAKVFHEKCGTLTPAVQKRIEDLDEGIGIVLMTAHQPNLFAYSGVFRKATLIYVLAKKLEEILNIPVVSFFGVADQDFTDDRWAKSATLPSVNRRSGVLELRIDLPEKTLLNRVPKPSNRILTDWKSSIERWLESEVNSIQRACKMAGIKLDCDDRLRHNFESFWEIVGDAYESATSFSDFNSFFMSKIVNKSWGYDVLFSRFSECEQVFTQEFSFLISHFEAYSRNIRVALSMDLGKGVFENEYETVPFWYHCDCGSKARLKAEFQGRSFLGRGKCLGCQKEHEIDFGAKEEPKISEISSRISARSVSMPLVFFEGLGVCCYVGGVGGKRYLAQAEYVAHSMGMTFPLIAIWRPRDIYSGMGQLEALIAFERISGTFDLSHYSLVRTRMLEKVASVQKEIDKLEMEKRVSERTKSEEGIKTLEELKRLSARQNALRRSENFSSLIRNLKLLENVVSVLNMYPSVIDYALNIGLPETSKQWMDFLEEKGDFSSEVSLVTFLDEIALGLRKSGQNSIIGGVN